MNILSIPKPEKITGIKGVAHLYQHEEGIGVASISRFHFDEEKNRLYNLRNRMESNGLFHIYSGDYVRLLVNGRVMMSDTPMERLTNKDFIDNAHGRVMIAGLGIGLITQAIQEKENVSEIIVVEKHQDVIRLVADKIMHPKIKILNADIFDNVFDKTDKFDTIYFDIWPTITTDNLQEMAKLHRMYSKNKRTKESYMDSWMRDFLRKKRRSENRYRMWYP